MSCISSRTSKSRSGSVWASACYALVGDGVECGRQAEIHSLARPPHHPQRKFVKGLRRCSHGGHARHVVGQGAVEADICGFLSQAHPHRATGEAPAGSCPSPPCRSPGSPRRAPQCGAPRRRGQTTSAWRIAECDRSALTHRARPETGSGRTPGPAPGCRRCEA